MILGKICTKLSTETFLSSVTVFILFYFFPILIQDFIPEALCNILLEFRLDVLFFFQLTT